MLSEARLKRDALRIFRAALRAASPAEAVRRHLRLVDGVLHAGRKRYPLSGFDRIFVAGAGKAGASMAAAVERILGRHLSGGVINVKTGHLAKLRRIELVEAGHPVPDAAGVAGSERIARLAQEARARDLLICLISGGASALMPLPAEPVTLEEKQETTRLLLACGATIHQINAVRKHLSRIKGGQLARIAAPATVISLMLSDVIGDDLDVIGSGPTAPDASTFATALAVLGRYSLIPRVPASVRERLEAGARGEIAETPEASDPIFRRVQNLVVGSNRLAIDAAAAEARRLGYHTLPLTSFLEGEAREAGRFFAGLARQLRSSAPTVRLPACLLAGGETTVTLRGSGKGGRNQELALSAALALAGLPSVALLSAGTDGTDGPTDAAGAIVTGSTLDGARKSGASDPHNALRENDSYNFFAKAGGLLRTGPTNTNVMDVQILLAG